MDVVAGLMVAIPGTDWPLVLGFAQERHAGAYCVRSDYDRALRATGLGVPAHEPQSGTHRRVAGEARKNVGWVERKRRGLRAPPRKRYPSVAFREDEDDRFREGLNPSGLRAIPPYALKFTTNPGRARPVADPNQSRGSALLVRRDCHKHLRRKSRSRDSKE